MDELIVDSRHCDEVVELLTDRLHVLPADHHRDSDDTTDLTLIGPLELDDYVPAARVSYSDETDLTGVDLLFYDVGRRFADRHGFVPVLDRNSDDVYGNPQHKSVGPAYPAYPVPIPETTDGQGVHIGVIDTAPTHHSDLPSSHVLADTYYVPDEHATLWAGHGTFVAGIIRQHAPAAIIHMRAGLASDSGRCSRWQLVKDIGAFAGDDIQILNLSLGFETADHAVPSSIARALSRLRPEVLVVAAAGNDHTDRVWPGAFGSVIDVGSTGGPSFAWINAAAPGNDVRSAFLHAAIDGTSFGGYASWRGTSFAAAFVSGSVAARMSTAGVAASDAYRLLLNDPDSMVAALHA
ncbi:S8 family serine peptidase [Kutzneria sp. 744]|uniref:S8 family serine peptidase n=1 Tax=Kutzneria sp. (strain 744) TaxID=345341 RepID=UPI0004B505EF|nr:S8 family serine peptidase [Kutzneria sp. 744]